MIEKLSASQPGLLHQFVEQTDPQVFLRMRHADVAGSLRVGEDVMAALGAPQNPADLVHSAIQLGTGLCVCRTHRQATVNDPSLAPEMASSPGVSVVLSLCGRCDRSCGVSRRFHLAAVARLML